jgi:hypothetical protein
MVGRVASGVALGLALVGCGGYFTDAGRSSAIGAVQGATDDASRKLIDQAAVQAAAAARDEALGPATEAALQKLIAGAGESVRVQILSIVTAQLQNQMRRLVRVVIDEAFGPVTLAELDAARERVVGASLQADMDAIVGAEIPKVVVAFQTSMLTALAPLQHAADAEAAKWRPIAIAFAVGAVFLFVALVFTWHVLQTHRKLLDRFLPK